MTGTPRGGAPGAHPGALPGALGVLAAVMYALAGGGCGGAPPPAVEPDNLVLVTVSSLRADHLGIYGYPRNITPRLDLFAAGGAMLLDGFSPAPETGRAGVAVLTGLDPARASHGSPARLLPFPTLAGLLRERGFRTVGAVSHPALAGELGFAAGFGAFHEFWEEGRREADEAVVSLGVRELGAALPGEPLFLWLHLSAPTPSHEAFAEEAASLAGDGLTPAGPRFRTGPVPAAAEASGGAAYGEAVDRYDAAIRAVDEAFGRVLDAVLRGPGAGRTLLVALGLHGESLGEHAPRFSRPRALFRETVHVPLVFGRPGAEGPAFLSGTRFGGVVSIADAMPTAIALIGLPPAESVADPGQIGKSLLPALAGEELRPHRRLYARSEGGLFSIFDGRFKMLRIPVPGQQAPLFALFNLVRDPNEAENRYPEARSNMEPLRAELETRRIRTVAWQQENARGAGEPAPLSEALSESLQEPGSR